MHCFRDSQQENVSHWQEALRDGTTFLEANKIDEFCYCTFLNWELHKVWCETQTRSMSVHHCCKKSTFYIYPTLAPSLTALPNKRERPKASLALLGLSQNDLASISVLAGTISSFSVYSKLHMLFVVSISALPLPLPYHPQTAELSLFKRCWRWYVCARAVCSISL